MAADNERDRKIDEAAARWQQARRLVQHARERGAPDCELVELRERENEHANETFKLVSGEVDIRHQTRDGREDAWDGERFALLGGAAVSGIESWNANGGKPFLAWVQWLVNRRVREVWERAGYTGRRAVSVDSDVVPDFQAIDPEARALASDVLLAVSGADPQDFAAFMLTDRIIGSGLTFEAAAEQLGASPATVWRRRERVLARLREHEDD